MQIYYTDRDPAICAANLPDQLTYKILTEVAQLMSKFLWENGVDAPMKHISQGKAFCDWIKESRANWRWLSKYAESLNFQYMRRYDKDKPCESYAVVKTAYYLSENDMFHKLHPFTDPPFICEKSAPKDDFKPLGIHPIIEQYRLYLNWKVNKWRREGKCGRLYAWANRRVPSFIKLKS